jgi:hypothetical protein
LQEVESAARTMALHIQVLHASNGREIGAAFAAFERERPRLCCKSLRADAVELEFKIIESGRVRF